MTDKKKPPDGAGQLRWAVARDPDGPLELTIYEAGVASMIELSANEATLLAFTLLTDGGNDFDAEAATLRLSALAGQIVTNSQHDFSLAELTKGHDVVGNPGTGIFDGMADVG